MFREASKQGTKVPPHPLLYMDSLWGFEGGIAPSQETVSYSSRIFSYTYYYCCCIPCRNRG